MQKKNQQFKLETTINSFKCSGFQAQQEIYSTTFMRIFFYLFFFLIRTHTYAKKTNYIADAKGVFLKPCTQYETYAHIHLYKHAYYKKEREIQ